MHDAEKCPHGCVNGVITDADLGGEGTSSYCPLHGWKAARGCVQHDPDGPPPEQRIRELRDGRDRDLEVVPLEAAQLLDRALQLLEHGPLKHRAEAKELREQAYRKMGL